ncbi:O-antigen ligase family protein [Shewanella sp. MR-4]|uniref:O-antigen ligase family protein n=1 Tax=Shewanella sp. (strain MR-4) TaxID=60480 RepID=UPI0003162585|nr:O-antigen ligase family protein [Shewanella sp. MR-4]
MKAYAYLVLVGLISFFLLGTTFALDVNHVFSINNEYDLKRILAIAFIWLMVLMLSFKREHYLLRLKKQSIAFLVFFFGLGSISALYSQHSFWSWIELGNILLCLIGLYCFSSVLRSLSTSQVYRFCYFFSLVISIATLLKYLLFLVFHYIELQPFNIHGLIYGYVNVRFFNQLQVMMVPLLLLPFFSSELKRFSVMSLILISLHWMVLLQTEARGAMVSLISAMVLISFFLGADIRKSLIAVVCRAILLGISLWLLFIVIIPILIMGDNFAHLRGGSSGRLDLWMYVVNNISEHLLLGHGPMAFAWAENKPLPHAHPHNSVMQLLYEYGVVVCMGTILWVGSYLANLLASLKQETNVNQLPIIMSLLTALIYSLFSGVVVMPFAQLLLVFVVSVTALPLPAVCYPVSALVRGIAVMGVSLLSWALLASYHHSQLLSALFPRFWVNGLLSY